MKLQSLEGPSIELDVDGYQYPGLEVSGARDWDANWLVVRGAISGTPSWSFRAPCLTTWEARELADWLDGVAHNSVRPSPDAGGVLSFTEPNLRVELRARKGDEAVLAFFFAHESCPPGASEEIRFGDGFEIEIVTSTAAVSKASKAWSIELDQFPAR